MSGERRTPLTKGEKNELLTLLVLPDEANQERLAELLVRLPRGVTPKDFACGNYKNEWLAELQGW